MLGSSGAAAGCGFANPVLLFAGQGSQVPGNGKRMAEANPEAMQLWHLAEKESGLPLREIYWEGPEDAMSDTAALQPALTAFCCALWKELRKKTGMKPFAAAGHSLGEFSAFAAAGVISPESAIKLTALRGRLMAEADPDKKGAMAAILKLDSCESARIAAEAASETGEMLVAANFNTPSQLVVSGEKEAVELACKKAKERKGRAVLLAVSGAFHSPLMQKANEVFTAELDRVCWRDPAFPVYCNVNAKPVTTAAEARQACSSQMVSSVHWVDTIRNIYAAGGRSWLEIGPKSVLGKMVAPCLAALGVEDPDVRVVNSLAAVQNFD